jgi:hypothetical protein
MEWARSFVILSFATASLLLMPYVLVPQSVGNDASEELTDWVPFITLDKGYWSYYGYDDHNFDGEYFVFRDHTAWASFWLIHTKGITPQPPVPANISWDLDMVLVSVFGWWRDCCQAYTNFTSAYIDGDTLYAYVQNIYEHGMMQAVTNPFHIIVLEKVDNVVFVSVPGGLDVYPPEGSITVNGADEWTNTSFVTLTLTYCDYFSGVSQVRYSNDGVWDDEPWEAPVPRKAWTLEEGDGAKVVYYQLIDNVGWVSNTFTDDILLDTTPPSAFIDFPSEGQTLDLAEITILGSASDNLEINRVDIRINGGPWQTAVGTLSWSAYVDLLPGSNTIEAMAWDMASNPSTIVSLNLTYTPIHPGPPVIIRAFLSGLGSEDVTFLWTLSSDDVMGQGSVVRYEIYRGNAFSYAGLGYNLIASLPNGTSLYVDALRGEGDPSNYFYRVCAVDSDSNITCGKKQAGKFTRPLEKGPNLASIPLTQDTESIQVILHTVKYEKAWYYRSLERKWISLMKSKPYLGSFRSMDHSVGLWIDVTEDSNLTVAGVVPEFASIHLKSGWNLLGFPKFTSGYTVGELKAETGAIRVEGFDPSAPTYSLKDLGDGDTLKIGYGYWILVEIDTAWIIRNS